MQLNFFSAEGEMYNNSKVMNEIKANISKNFRRHENDNGSTSVQIALLTSRLESLLQHSNANKGDAASRRGLLSLVNKRKKLLIYLSRKDYDQYLNLIKALGLRR